jgi:UDP-N-acetylmuramoylalanine--D-glutamate ligase
MKENENQLKVAFSASKLAERRSEPSVFEHSLEFVARINQVNYINDSKATSVNDTWNSLSVMTEPTVLILGGNDRRSDFSVLRGLVGEKVKAVVCIGSEREKIFSALMGKSMIVHASDLEEAVKISNLLARPGQTVLFSPGCPSFDAFDNYKNRGNKFKELVSVLS